MSNPYRDYLFDLGDEIRRSALEAKAARDALQRGSPDELFQSGRVMAYNEVVSIMLQSARGFGISAAELRLGDLEPDRDLL